MKQVSQFMVECIEIGLKTLRRLAFMDTKILFLLQFMSGSYIRVEGL